MELGWVDLTTEISIMASHLPGITNTRATFSHFLFLDHHHNSELDFDPSDSDINDDPFRNIESWRDTVYSIGSYGIPPNAPHARGYGFRTFVYVNSDRMLEMLCYNLRMMSLHRCDHLAYIFIEITNLYLVPNASKPPCSVLKKKEFIDIIHHFVREEGASSRDEWGVAYIATDDTIVDIMLTKPLSGGSKRSRFIGMVLHHLP